MARKSAHAEPKPATLSPQQMASAIPPIERRIADLKQLNVAGLTENEGDDILRGLVQKVNATLRDIFGTDTIEYNEYRIESLSATPWILSADTDTSLRSRLPGIEREVRSAISSLETLRDILAERLGPGEPAGGNRVLRAYEGLDLHQEIARAASGLYRDGHFANAVEAAVKALNGLVRLRSGLEIDGTALMERAFSANNPILQFNSLSDQSDRDEQKGFMMLFSGAVAGLRNPRAHKFVQDDPERALEFISIVSLLAKLLDDARKN